MLEMEIKRFQCKCGCELFLMQKWRYIHPNAGRHQRRGERTYWCLDCHDYTEPKWVLIPNNGTSDPIVATPSSKVARLERMVESLLDQKLAWIEREASRLERLVHKSSA